jgi:hypothetical protein
VETGNGTLVYRNGSGAFLVALPDDAESYMRTAYWLKPLPDNKNEFKVTGPARVHQFLRHSPSEWNEPESPLPAQVLHFIDFPPPGKAPSIH